MKKPSTKQTWWSTIGITLVLGIIGMFNVDIDWSFGGDDDFSTGKPTAIHNNLAEASLLYSDLFEWMPKLGTVKIVLLRAHDSGTPIPTKSSVVAEVMTDQARPVMNEWSAQKLDGPYIEMLKQLAMTGRIINVTSEMDHGALKTVYQARGVDLTDVHLIGATEDELWYVSIVFQDIPDDFDSTTQRMGPGYEDAVRVGLGKIRNRLRAMGAIK